MKKILLIILVLALLSITLPVSAAKNEASSQGAEGGQQGTVIQIQQLQISPSSAGNQVQNQNQINTQNKGEDSQLQVNTQEQENLGDGQGEGLQIRSQTAAQNMSEVAKQVQQLLQAKTTGGIGEQVKQVAQEQNQAQAQIQKQLNKLDSKGKLARLFTGTDYTAVKNLKTQLEQNQLRVRQLEQLQTELFNQGEITMVQETIQALIQENTFLQEIITAEEQVKSLLGWLFRLFNR
ncbi:MAG: hypothetical protein V1858_01810 [Candidatus Gottesmanbacteria bacterium]